MKIKGFVENIFHKPIHSITGAAIVIGATTLASGLMGVVRDRLLASSFGAGNILDAYYAAFRIPDFLYAILITGALSASFIPLFIKQKNDGDGQENAWGFTRKITNFVGATMIILGALIFIFSPFLAKILAPGFSEENILLTANLMKILCLSPFILGVSTIFSSALQAEKKFIANALAPVLYNAGIIAGILLLTNKIEIYGAAVGVIFGALLHLISQFIMITKSGYAHKIFYVSPKDETIKEITKLTLPRIATILIFQLQTSLFILIASKLATGSISVYQLASNLYYLPSWIFGLSFAVAAFPTLSDIIVKNDKKEFILQLSFVLRQILFFSIPASLLIVMLRTEIVRVVLGSGQFDWVATKLTADTLAIFAVGITITGIYHLFVRAFFAARDTITPLYVSLISVAIGTTVALILVYNFPTWIGSEKYAVLGLAVGFIFSNFVSVVALWIMLRKKFGEPEKNILEHAITKFTKTETTIVKSVLRITIASVLLSVTVQVIKITTAPYLNLETFVGVLGRLFFASLGGIIIYSIIMFFLKSPELEHFISSFQKKWLKVREDQQIDA